LPWTRPPQERFARQVLRAVLATGRVASARYDPDDFSIAVRLPGDEQGRDGKIFLENTFRETQGMARRQRAERVRRLVGIVVRDRSPAEGWEQVRPKLRPVIRGVSYGAAVRRGGGPAVSPLWRPVLPYLAEMVVVDEPTSMSYVSAGLLAGWGVSEDELFAAARENLLRLVPAPQGPGPGEGRAILRFADTGDDYFVSMLLVPGFLAGLAPSVGGRPVAFIPDRDTLMVAADESDALSALFPMVEREYDRAPRSLSPVAYTVDDRGAVVPYPAPVHPTLAGPAHRAQTLLAHGEYSAQKEFIDARHEADGVDIFVASLLVTSAPDGAVASVAVWTEHVDTLLPEADLIAFQPGMEGQSALMVPFDVVAREAVLLPEPDFNPPRYRVTAWPAEEVMAHLRPHAVQL
jgi:hypothetical protein